MASKETLEERKDRMRLVYDLNKHITTLATGTLLLMTGLIDKVFKSPIWKPLICISFICFAICVVLCVIAMFGFSMYSRTTWNTDRDPIDFASRFFSFGMTVFIFGIILLTVFAVKNF